MQNTANFYRLGCLLLFATLGTAMAGAQTTPGGQVVTPGTQGKRSTATNCSASEAPTNADGTCADPSPGFVSPGLDTPSGDRPRNVAAFVRVEGVMSRPPVALPTGDSFSVVGNATLVRVHRAEVGDCLATGKRLSARAGASTSTTCLDRKGELLAYQECRSNTADCVVVTAQDVAKQQEAGSMTGTGKQ